MAIKPAKELTQREQFQAMSVMKELHDAGTMPNMMATEISAAIKEKCGFEVSPQYVGQMAVQMEWPHRKVADIQKDALFLASRVSAIDNGLRALAERVAALEAAQAPREGGHQS